MAEEELRMKAVRRMVAVATALVAVLGLGAPAGADDEELTQGQFEQFETFVLDDVDAYWAAFFASQGASYDSADYTFVPPGEVIRNSCGYAGDPAEFPGVVPAGYCAADGRVYISTPFLYREFYLIYGDFAAAAVIAHELGHHAQYQAGALSYSGEACCGQTTPEIELQADCFAGNWADHADEQDYLSPGDIEEAQQAWMAMGDEDHGTGEERANWFTYGYEAGDPFSCETS
jgi:hypothetical protein